MLISKLVDPISRIDVPSPVKLLICIVVESPDIINVELADKSTALTQPIVWFIPILAPTPAIVELPTES